MLLSLWATFYFDRTLELIFVSLSLRVKVLGFRNEGEFKEEEDDRINKVILVNAIEQTFEKEKEKKCLFKFKENEES